MSGDEISPLLQEEHEENIEQARPQRSLPPGKTYHIFISYSSHDHSYVLRLKNALERLGFKCMLADHDFSFGVTVMRNIEKTIQTSHKFLLVVSQHFLQSGMCDREVDMAHKYAADIGRNDFMIILRLDESAMPLKLNYMTYIDGVDRDVKDVGREVEKAFDGFVDVPVPQIGNGQRIIRQKPMDAEFKMCCSSSYEFLNLNQIQKNTLLTLSIEDSKECYRKIMKEANDSFLLKRYAVFVCDLTLCAFWFLLVFGIAIVSISLYILLSILTVADTYLLYDMLVISSSMIVLTVLLHTACTVYLFRKTIRRLCSIVRENTDCKSQNYIVIPSQHWNNIYISFIYYDMKPCWNYLEQRAREHWPDYSEEEIATKCNEELVTTILGSFKGKDFNRIPQAASVRHSTYQSRCCLCMITKSPWTKRNPALNAVPEQILENNQNEESISSDLHAAGAVGEISLTEEEQSLSMRGPEEGTSRSGTEGDTLLIGAEGGTPLTETIGSLSDSNIARWFRKPTSAKQPQMSHELITLDKTSVNLTNPELSTSLNDLEEGDTQNQSGDGELEWFRGEHFIDEATHAKIPV